VEPVEGESRLNPALDAAAIATVKQQFLAEEEKAKAAREAAEVQAPADAPRPKLEAPAKSAKSAKAQGRG